MEYQGSAAQTVAFLKREPYKTLNIKDQAKKVTPSGTPGEGTIEDEYVDISNQIQVINMGYIGQDSNIFELASTYLDFSILPLFQDYKSKSSGPSQGESSQATSSGLDNVLKGLSSLKMNLAQCLSNQDIPEIELAVDSEVKERV